MTQAYGQDAAIALGFQDSGGTANVSSLYFIPFLSDGIGVAKEPLTSQNMAGYYDAGDDYEGVNTVDGELSAEAEPIPLGMMLAAVFGRPTSTQLDTGVYQHVFEPRQDDFDRYFANDPVTMHKHLGDPGSASLFYDLNGGTLNLSVANGEFLQATVGFVGGKESQEVKTAASYDRGKRWTWDSTSAQINGASVDELMDVAITLNEQLEAQHTLKDQKTPSRIKRTEMRTVEVSGTIKFETQDEYQAFRNQSERPLELHFRGASEISSGYRESLTVEAPALRYREFRPAADGAGPIEPSFTAAAKYHASSGTALLVTLVNTQATY